jgi:hypothetical protein
VDPVPDPLLLTKSGSAGNRTRTSGSLARSSDHQTTEAVSRIHNPTIKLNTTQKYRTDVTILYYKAASILGENEN